MSAAGTTPAPDAERLIGATTDETSSPTSDIAAPQQAATSSEPNAQDAPNAAPLIITTIDDTASSIPKESATQPSTSSEIRSNTAELAPRVSSKATPRESEPKRRKRAGHLLSKHRFLAAQFAAMLADDRWLALARHANLMADQLSAKLGAVGLAPLWPVEANLVFVVMPRALDARLKAAGARYYLRTNTSLKLDPDQILARLVTSFATKEEEIERFVQLCQI